MQQNVTYSYLVAWMVGGLVLLTIVMLRTHRRPYSLAFALIGYGATGFLSLGLGWAVWSTSWLYAWLVGGFAGALGIAVQRLARQPEPTRLIPLEPPLGPPPA